MRARLVSLVAALVLGSALPACDKQKMTEVAVPDEGVTLRYDLTPGQVYAGHVKVRNAITTPAGEIVTRIEFDVDLLVTGNRDETGPLLTATVKTIKVDAQVPDGIPKEMTGLSDEVAKQLEGVEISFNIDERGKVSNLPDPPADLPMPVKATLAQLTSGILFGLVRVPETSLKKGQTWTPEPTREDPKVKVEGTGTFEGMVQSASGISLAKLSLESRSEGEREAEGQKLNISSSQQVAVLFAPEAGFPTEVKRNLRSTLGAAGDLVGEAEVTWTKGEKRDVKAAPAGEVQEKSDPCDPDYVGPQECKDGSEQQNITDPCDPDYVGPEECKEPPPAK
jgi:hypothetical protein